MLGFHPSDPSSTLGGDAKISMKKKKSKSKRLIVGGIYKINPKYHAYGFGFEIIEGKNKAGNIAFANNLNFIRLEADQTKEASFVCLSKRKLQLLFRPFDAMPSVLGYEFLLGDKKIFICKEDLIHIIIDT